MALLFGTDAWAKALCEALNNSSGYQSAAKKWEGDMCFVCTPGGGVTEEITMYFDLHHGECRGAYVITDAGHPQPAFTITAPLGNWKEVVAGRLDPIKGLTRGKLKLKGNLLQILKMPKAALEMVAAATTIETEWPG